MNWLVEFEEPGEKRRNRKSSDGIPNEEHDNAVSSWLALFPSDIRVKNESKDGSKDIGDTTTEPE